MTGRDRYILYRDDAAARRAALGATLLTAAVLLAPLWPLVLAAVGTLAAAFCSSPTAAAKPSRPVRTAVSFPRER